jgi:uncharacterized protein with HEPN domain
VSASREEREQQRLRYIRESIRRIERYTRGGQDAFLGDEMAQDAVLRRLETLADAAHRLPEEIKAHHPHIPWDRVYGFRNVAAHDYERIEMEQVWDVIETHLPSLKLAIAAEITPLSKSSPSTSRSKARRERA